MAGKPSSFPPVSNTPGEPSAQWILVERQPAPGGFRRVLTGFAWVALVASLLLNVAMYYGWREYFQSSNPPAERFHSGDRTAKAKIAVVKIHGTIMPPFTERWIKQIEKAAEDEDVRAVLLDIDSPGGLVADSHQIYRKLRELNAKKPVAVAMKRLAASGGYYIAMGTGVEGRIFAEPTTWTGSIGVIIPRYEAADLAQKVGVSSDPIKKGVFKDSLSPFRELTPEEDKVWDDIITDSYDRFVGVIAENRKDLKVEQIRALATGQIYTAEQAKSNGLVDEIGYDDDALEWLKKKCELTEARIVTYSSPVALVDLLLGAKSPPRTEVEAILDASVPRAMYYFSWGLGGPVVRSDE